MKERPILFNGDMVRAILDGRKTQTRRAVKPRIEELIRCHAGQPGEECEVSFRYDNWFDDDGKVYDPEWLCFASEYPEEGIIPIGQCPYGQPGDRLWVRETWTPGYFHNADADEGLQVSVIYRADSADITHVAPSYELAEEWERSCSEDGPDCPRWRPSIHMPRWASRITLEIVSVRVERLQEISSDDEDAEGIDACIEDPSTVAGQAFNEAEHYAIAGAPMENTPETIGKIAHLNALGLDWDANPWVWVVDFKQIGGNDG